MRLSGPGVLGGVLDFQSLGFKFKELWPVHNIIHTLIVIQPIEQIGDVKIGSIKLKMIDIVFFRRSCIFYFLCLGPNTS